MNEIFDGETSEQIGLYVYRLIDPRNGETFYVGKGSGNRVFDHARAQLSLSKDEDPSSEKLSRIHEIRRSGLEIVHVIHRHGIPKEAIFEVEAAVIDAFPGLSNVASGHGSNDRGPMHAAQIIDKFALPTIDHPPEDKLILININNFAASSDEDLYRQVRFAWRLNRDRAERADYVLAVMRGVVVGAFVAESWKPATQENFPELSYDLPERSGFSGVKAPPEVQDRYCGARGKRIALPELRHVQNPIRYWNI